MQENMKEKTDNKNLPGGIDSGISFSELDENQEFDRTEYEEDNFYSFLGEDHNNLGEMMRSWESLRFMI
jgi:hypothetical protein